MTGGKQLGTQGISFDDNTSVKVQGQVFVLTGDFASGDKALIAMKIEKRGGKVVDGISAKTNVLVVGNDGSKAWVNGVAGGKKVEKANELKSKGNGILIINESMLLPLLDSNENDRPITDRFSEYECNPELFTTVSSDDGVFIKSYNGTSKKVRIPDFINGELVTGICGDALGNPKNAKNIVFPDSVRLVESAEGGWIIFNEDPNGLDYKLIDLNVNGELCRMGYFYAINLDNFGFEISCNTGEQLNGFDRFIFEGLDEMFLGILGDSYNDFKVDESAYDDFYEEDMDDEEFYMAWFDNYSEEKRKVLIYVKLRAFLLRLLYPTQLSEENKETTIEFLKKNNKNIFSILLEMIDKTDDYQMMVKFFETEFVTKKNVEKLLKSVHAKKNTELLALTLNLAHKRFKSLETEYKL